MPHHLPRLPFSTPLYTCHYVPPRNVCLYCYFRLSYVDAAPSIGDYYRGCGVCLITRVMFAIDSTIILAFPWSVLHRGNQGLWVHRLQDKRFTQTQDSAELRLPGGEIWSEMSPLKSRLRRFSGHH